jgi:hypothetical protein
MPRPPRGGNRRGRTNLPPALSLRRVVCPTAHIDGAISSCSQNGACAFLLQSLKGEDVMLFTIAAILIVLWLLGFVVFHVSSALLHVLLVVAIIVGLVQLFRGRRV